VSRLHAELVVLTGDVQARSMVLDALGERSRAIAVQVPGPGPDDTTTDGDIDEQVRALAAERAAEHTRRAIETFERERGRGAGLAVTGLGPVIHTLQRNQAATVLLRDDPSSDLLVWVGPEPAQLAPTESELREIDAPVLGQDRADAALIRAIAGTGAELVLLPHPEAGSDPGRAGSAAGGASIDQQPELTNGIGALLRFSSGEADR
jgi:Bacterial archaeo-eukaryotic release factor family 2